jgi:hypothetical protein
VVSHAHYRRDEETTSPEAQAVLQNMSDVWLQKLSQRLQMQTMPGRQSPLEETRTRRQVDSAPSISLLSFTPQPSVLRPSYSHTFALQFYGNEKRNFQDSFRPRREIQLHFDLIAMISTAKTPTKTLEVDRFKPQAVVTVNPPNSTTPIDDLSPCNVKRN